LVTVCFSLTSERGTEHPAGAPVRRGFLVNCSDLSSEIGIWILDRIPQSLDCLVDPALRNSAVYAHETTASGAERIPPTEPEARVLDQKTLDFILGE